MRFVFTTCIYTKEKINRVHYKNEHETNHNSVLFTQIILFTLMISMH